MKYNYRVYTNEPDSANINYPSTNNTRVVLKYSVMERGGALEIDLSHFGKMKEEFFMRFTEAVFTDTDLVGMINFDEFLKNLQPFYKMMGATCRTNLYDEYSDTFLLMRYISCVINLLNKNLKINTFKLLKQCLKFQVTNAFVYIYLFFSLVDKDLKGLLNDYGYKELKAVTNKEIEEFLYSKINEGRDIRANNPEMIHMLSLFIQLIEEHFVLIVELIKETKLSHEREEEFIRQGAQVQFTFQRKYTMNDHSNGLENSPQAQNNPYEIEEISSPKIAGSPTFRKRAYSVHFLQDAFPQKSEEPKDPLQQNGILSEVSLSIDSVFVDRELCSRFMRKNKLIYFMPNFYLGKSTLLLWIHLVQLVICRRKRLKDMDIELKAIATSLKNIKYNLEEIIRDYCTLSKDAARDACDLDAKINDILCKIVMECDDPSTVSDVLDILSELRNESFTRKISM